MLGVLFDGAFSLLVSVVNWLNLNRTSRPEVFCKKGVQNFTKFTGKHLCQSLFFNQVAGLRPATFFKKTLWHRCFSMNFVKLKNTYFYRTPPITASVQNFVSISNQIYVAIGVKRYFQKFLLVRNITCIYH